MLLPFVLAGIMSLFTLMLAVLLAGTHLLAAKLRFMSAAPRSGWLSAAGGVSVAYVFVHLLPELNKGQATLESQSAGTVFEFFEVHAYLVALAGLIVFHGLERMARVSKERSPGNGIATPPAVFCLHIAAFGTYNALIGYLLLHRDVQGSAPMLFYFFAMALHFLVNDYGLYQHHKWRYKHYGRWVLAGAVIAGWIVGFWSKVHPATLAALFAFLAGGVVINVLKEELPETGGNRFSLFAAGAGAYGALLILA